MDSEIFKHIPNPEPATERARAKVHARAGELPHNQAICPHPISSVGQFMDERPGRAPIHTNWFQCGVCHATLFLVDGFGKEAVDG